MKKSIFLSVLALAAVVSCQKSEIVDSKYGNEAIAFESYLGRDAQTKGAVVELEDLTGATVYGYYTGNDAWTSTTAANLWPSGLNLVINNGTVAALADSDVRYWANATDKYSFFAYAPINNANLAAPSTTNPTLSYSVDPTTSFANHVDVLRAVPTLNKSKQELDGTVDLVFKHTLSRITVKAKVDNEKPFDFHIKSIKLKGKFNTAGTLALSNSDPWTVTTVTDNAEFTFYTNSADPNAASTTAVVLGTTYTDYCADFAQGHMMVIPTEFTATNFATLEVVYTTNFANVESREYTVNHKVESPFAMGYAYTFNLDFEQATNNDIKFTVDVTPWDESAANTTTVEIK